MANKKLKHFSWVLLNIYGRLFGRRSLTGFHRTLLAISLHGLGYDNTWKMSYTGEGWFIGHVLPNYGVKVCLDVGANVGEYSKELLLHGHEVHALEPSTHTFKALSRIEGIHTYNVAVSNYDGRGSLFSPVKLAGTATLDRELLSKKDVEKEDVRVVTLDSFAAANHIAPDFIKIDVEGFEREVLEGMKTLRPRVIQFEFNIMQLKRGYTLLALTALLPGYAFYRLLPRGMIRIDPEKFVNNIFMFSNYVALREE